MLRAALCSFSYILRSFSFLWSQTGPLFCGLLHSAGAPCLFSQQTCLSVLDCPLQNCHLHTCWAEQRTELQPCSSKGPEIIYTEKGKIWTPGSKHTHSIKGTQMPNSEPMCLCLLWPPHHGAQPLNRRTPMGSLKGSPLSKVIHSRDRGLHSNRRRWLQDATQIQ